MIERDIIMNIYLVAFLITTTVLIVNQLVWKSWVDRLPLNEFYKLSKKNERKLNILLYVFWLTSPLFIISFISVMISMIYYNL